jgi:xanthine dehydrogenase YagT iron-sulfur-binding subunit
MGDMKEQEKPPALSRRGFLKGVGAGTAAATFVRAVEQDAAAQETAQGPQVLGPGAFEVRLQINGEERAVEVEPRTTLLDALRNRLDMTGAKKVCDRGTCGACTVLIDGHPAYSCTTLAVEAEGRQIRTVEGLGSPFELTELQKAFIEHDGSQCGFCTPGLIVACTAFLEQHPDPTLDEVRDGLGGNLCRCGTYHGVMAAVLATAKSMKGGA